MTTKTTGYEAVPHEIELRECPLCGREAKLTQAWMSAYSSMEYTIKCTAECCGFKIKSMDGLAKIAERWNTRYEEQDAEPEPEKDP